MGQSSGRGHLVPRSGFRTISSITWSSASSASTMVSGDASQTVRSSAPFRRCDRPGHNHGGVQSRRVVPAGAKACSKLKSSSGSSTRSGQVLRSASGGRHGRSSTPSGRPAPGREQTSSTNGPFGVSAMHSPQPKVHGGQCRWAEACPCAGSPDPRIHRPRKRDHARRQSGDPARSQSYAVPVAHVCVLPPVANPDSTEGTGLGDRSRVRQGQWLKSPVCVPEKLPRAKT